MIDSPTRHPHTIEQLHADMLWDFRVLLITIFILWLILFITILVTRGRR